MKRAFLFFLLVPLFAYSQNKPKIDTKYHVDDNGKLYWHGKSPVYLFISDNPEGTNIHRLKSEVHPQYTNPLYLDTEGINYIRTNWAADSALKQVLPKIEVLFEVYRDNTAPKTNVAFEGAAKYKDREGKTFYGTDLKLTSKATDIHSGVQKTFLSVDNTAFSSFNGEKTLSEDKEYDIKIYSADNTGNVEPIQMYDFRVDLTPPVSEYTVEGDRSGMVFSNRTKVQLESRDAASGLKKIAYKIDDSAELTYSNQVSLSKLSDGNHTLTYYGYDRVKNKEEEKVVEFYLDNKEPLVESTVVGDQYQNRGRVFISTRTKVKLTAEDNKAGIKKIMYSVDGSEPERYYEPFALNKSKGKHIVTYYAVDKVNNQYNGVLNESNLNRSSLNIDMDAPVISHSYQGPKYINRDTTFITSNSKVNLAAIDAESGLKDLGYKINGGEGKTYDEPFQIEKEGVFSIDFYGTDQVNNRNTKSFYFVVDNTGPVTEDILSIEPIGSINLDEKEGESINVYPKGVKLFLAATDAIVDTDRIYYSLDGAPEVEYTKPVKINKKGLVSYMVRATDKLGNETSTEKKEIFIK